MKIVAALVCVFAAATVQAAGSRIYAPKVIDAPGKYRVIRNIVAEGTILTITASDVALDLGGFFLETTGAEPVVRIAPTLLENVSIVNGRIRGGSVGVLADRVTRLALSELDVVGSGVGFYLDDNDAVTVEGNSVRAISRGIELDGCSNCRITDNAVLGGFDSGIGLQAGAASEIARNRVTNTTLALRIGGTGMRVAANQLSNVETAIRVQAGLRGLLEDNLVANALTGIVFDGQSVGNVYRGNVIRGAESPLEDEGRNNASGGGNFLPDLDF